MSRSRARAAVLTAGLSLCAALLLAPTVPAHDHPDRATAGLARDSLRAALTRERFYFVMPDRFQNGDRANDQGGMSSPPAPREVTGFDPTRKGWYHGVDLKGMVSELDY